MDKYLSDEEEKTVEHEKTFAIQVLPMVGTCMRQIAAECRGDLGSNYFGLVRHS